MTSSHCYPNFNTIIHGILGFYLHEACGRTIEALNFGPITNNLKKYKYLSFSDYFYFKK